MHFWNVTNAPSLRDIAEEYLLNYIYVYELAKMVNVGKCQHITPLTFLTFAAKKGKQRRQDINVDMMGKYIDNKQLQ